MDTTTFRTSSSIQTKRLGALLAEELCGGPPRLAKTSARRREAGEIICLSGDLGAGKTTFAQGLLKGLKIKGPYTSPTFAILKQYNVSSRMYAEKKPKGGKYIIHATSYMLHVYHIDAYRITAKDLLELGFKDFAGKQTSITIIEWPENVKKIIPTNALWIDFKWLSDKEREITLSTKKER